MRADAPITLPPGVSDVSRWSLACATGHHGECTGTRMNPDPDAPVDKINLPCECSVDPHPLLRRNQQHPAPPTSA
ncbi:hypothetical protein [Streptosporangium sp. NPDC002524]|uniref:hypothetical protein n=1 Tax=Streptosporangium sp. NPDC002524 TaxID=3154537 RepID=UPI00332D5873